MAKKWSFILSCSGINQSSGYALPINIDKLHRSVDTFMDAYIKFDWRDLGKSSVPSLQNSGISSAVGLLKFVRGCYEQDSNFNDSEISCSILSIFPSFPVALFRALQNTNWLKHAVFHSFSISSLY